MVLLAEECATPPLTPDVPVNQAAISNRKEPITSQVRAGCAKKEGQSPRPRMVRANWMTTPTVEEMTIRALTRGMVQNSRKKEGAKGAKEFRSAGGETYWKP